MASQDYSPATILLCSVLAGVACGLWNGFLVAICKIQPIVATLILMVAGRGVAQLITEGQIITFNNDTLSWFGVITSYSIHYTQLYEPDSEPIWEKPTVSELAINEPDINMVLTAVAKVSFFNMIKSLSCFTVIIKLLMIKNY